MEVSCFVQFYEAYFKETYSLKRFVEVFGFSPEVLSQVYIKTKFWDCGSIQHLLLFYSFIKNGRKFARITFKISEATFIQRLWTTSDYLFHNLHEVS